MNKDTSNFLCWSQVFFFLMGLSTLLDVWAPLLFGGVAWVGETPKKKIKLKNDTTATTTVFSFVRYIYKYFYQICIHACTNVLEGTRLTLDTIHHIHYDSSPLGAT